MSFFSFRSRGAAPFIPASCLKRGTNHTDKKETHHVDLHRRGLADLAVPGGVVVVVHRDGTVGALGLLHAQQQAVDELGAKALGALAQEVVHDLAAAHADVLGLGEGAAGEEDWRVVVIVHVDPG